MGPRAYAVIFWKKFLVPYVYGTVFRAPGNEVICVCGFWLGLNIRTLRRILKFEGLTIGVLGERKSQLSCQVEHAMRTGGVEKGISLLNTLRGLPNGVN